MAIHRIAGTEAKGKLADLMRTKGKHSDGGGLYLQVAKEGQASWVFRYKDRQTQRDRWPCVGPASVYSIAEAREKAREARKAVLEGRDPFTVLRAGRAEPAGKTFAKAMAEYLAAKSPQWAASNRARELRRYEYLFSKIPDFVATPIKAIDQAAKNQALATWDDQAKARRDVGFYIEAIIRYAATGKLRIAKVSDDQGHHEAMPWRDVPSFYACISKLNSNVDARALRFTILTGARTDEVIGAEYKRKITKAPATWQEIVEIDGLPTWIIPGNRMKGKRTHHVPLTPQMLALLGERGADFVFHVFGFAPGQ